jgi:arylsulfatase A-like enzyme
MLNDQGYATAAIGKWHLGLGWTTLDGGPTLEDGTNVDYRARIKGGPTELGFDTCFNITGSLDMAPYCFIEDDHVYEIPTIEKHPYHPQQRSGLMPPGWRDDQVDLIFLQKAVEFIHQQAEKDSQQPFFLYLTPSAPHRPCIPPDFIRGRSQAGPRGDMVALVDYMVGEIDAVLNRYGWVENTLFVMTSDNGARITDFYGHDYGHKSCGDLRGQKADIWEGGHREPFIARWPGVIQPGSTSDQLICLGDLMATCAEIVGVSLADNIAEDSISFWPALVGDRNRVSRRQTIIHHSGDGMFSIRDRNWKLILGCGSGGFSEPRRLIPAPTEPPGQLYNMQSDGQEACNLWLAEPKIVERLKTTLDEIIIRGNRNLH